MKDLETVISKQSMLTLVFLPIHCALRFVFSIYTKETFELLALTCILVSLNLWLGKSRFLFAKTICHIYVGVFPVLMLIVVPSNLILAGCMNFLSLMFMTIVEDNTASLLVLVLSNSMAWTAFSFWERSPLEKYRETQVYARGTDISFGSQFFACVIISYIVLAMMALEKSRNNAQRLRCEIELHRLKGELDETKTKFTKSNEDLKNALNEKENFILRFSHEIRNPLNSLLGNVELLTEIAVEDKTLEMLRDARVCGEVLLQLVNNVLDTAKIAARQLEVSIGTFSVREFMEKIWVICGEIIRKKGLIGTLSLDFSTPEYLDFDKHRLMQIMINMASNATKFTDKGYVRMYAEFLPGDCIDPIDMKPKHLSRVGFSFSEFFISLEEYQNSRELDERENYLFDTLTAASKRFVRGNSLNSISNKLRLSYSKESRNHEIPGYLRIEIIDSGCGMTAEQTSSLFKKFGQVNAQANKRQVGTGLGLWITKELVEIMNGKIEVYSAANIGTCFVILIKSHSRSLCTQIKRSTTDYNLNKHNSRGAINCIVVEAITYNQEITRKFLQKCQVNNVFVVSNGKEAVNLFNSKPQQFFSFIIIDLDILHLLAPADRGFVK